MLAYIAGPLFNEGERWFDEQIEARVRRAGLETFLPHRDGDLSLREKRDIRRIFEEDRSAVDRADVVVANLNGITTDDGTAWELGYAYAKGKHLVGLYTDWRLQFELQTVNLMLECSLDKLVRSLDELEAYLREYAAGR
ncbi:MAG: nucleoside 2-deoxyribosyltransferase [Chloroflexi bacterium]|nr:nucleoside 2-deoxyribosyltransferase [Chloroflexota bacterium]MDL1884407.1 nucleoside 2-deoxyribosyltransferase [Anaerolineae bacterium CFX8]